MNKTVIKELQKLMALCMEINEKTDYVTHMDIFGEINTFSMYVGKPNISCEHADWVAMVEKITLSNINKCRQKLLKYKEW